ncbi:hypothetical protein SLEP1_g14520 [Rubroshorea leprosula]|uniref:Uncharacterized protein n=1 Tax=Rubroshorea leprosula TaxID=152421 RepID=A0AAV5IVX2_9ROSI|nr:hypothetical protein SLEP1_g14520 [Rubroshorea leprosula]
MLQSLHLFSSTLPPSISRQNPSFLLSFPKPTSLSTPSTQSLRPLRRLLAVAQEPTAAEEEGPVELPQSSTSMFSISNEPSTLQLSTSVLLTGAFTVFLFRTIRRRAKRAKELKFRSSGSKTLMKEEAMVRLKGMRSAPIDAKSPPSVFNALFGSIYAGVIALVLYKFTITIGAALNRQTISDNFSVRQITITIRTIVNGLCYLLTFVFGINSVGLFLYSGQLAMSPFMEGSAIKETESKGEDNLGSSVVESPIDGTELTRNKEDQSSDYKH